ncbi:hypothetical protein IOCL2690_000032200 [Leishmania lindenbergi]|uniref:Uncharacterized protein n=1 Tax=Leishmania lindenbergi TaxID=651832 RepID=A0AAW3B2H5_9TRYP
MRYRVVERVAKRSATDPLSRQTAVFSDYHGALHKIISYAEMLEMMRSLGRGLVKLRLTANAVVFIDGIGTQNTVASTV